MSLEKNTRPGIIIISSSSRISKRVVQAVERNLSGFANTVSWTMGKLEPEGKLLSKLEDHVRSFKFAIIIGCLEDFPKEGEPLTNQALLNYELGFILGKIGLKQTFFLIPEGHFFPIPVNWSDLELLRYNSNNYSQVDEFSEPCDYIIKRVRKILEETSEFDKSLIPNGIEDVEIQYDLHIINEVGDALVRKTIHFMVKEGTHTTRKHEIFSDSPQSYEELDLLAFDKNNRSLPISNIYDSELRKMFSVRFRRALKEGENYTYQVQYYWKELFPKGKSYFKAKITTKRLKFNLYFPYTWNIWGLNVKVKSADLEESFHEINLEDIELIRDEGLFKGYKIPLPNLIDEMQEIELDWDWD